MREMLVSLAALLLSTTASPGTLREWDYDLVSRVPLNDWMFMAADAPPQSPGAVMAQLQGRLATVDLPWRLERTRSVGYWRTAATVPESFTGREVWIVAETVGPARIFLGDSVLAESLGGVLRGRAVAAPGRSETPLNITIECRHGDKAPAKLISAALVAEPAGLSDVVAATKRTADFSKGFAVDVQSGPWRVMVRAPKGAEKPEFDDSQWKPGGMDSAWMDQETDCWFRARVKVPTEFLGTPTKGRQLGIRGKFNDEGWVFVNGVELRADSRGTLLLPNAVRPGEEVVIAVRVLNHKGRGQLQFLQWRLCDLDTVEAQLKETIESANAIVSVLKLHDRPSEDWVPQLSAAVRALDAGAADTSTLPGAIERTKAALNRLKESIASHPVITIPPYLQDVQRDRITIMWETSAPAASFALYGKEKARRKVPEVADNGTIHKVEITGLRPDTEYSYRIVSGEQRTAERRFRTAPEKPRPFTFLVWGDNRTDFAMCDHVCARMAENDADLVVNVGDVVTTGIDWPEWTTEYLVPIRHWAGKWPGYVAIGNHEYGGFQPRVTGVPPFEHYFTHPYPNGPKKGQYWYSFDYGNAHFICLDSEAFEIDVEVFQDASGKELIYSYDPQLKWLIADLEKSRNTAEWIFVFFHAPPYSEGWSGGYYDGEPAFRTTLVPQLERHGVDIVFSGHTHDYERGLPHPPYDPSTGKGNNTAYIITGGGGSGLDNHKYKEWEQIDIPDHSAVADSNEPDSGEYYKYHYCRVHVDGSNASFEACEVLPDGRIGPILDRFRLAK